MSDASRAVGRLLGRAVGRLTGVDRDSVLTAVLAVGTLLAVGLFVFGGFLADLLRFGLGSALYVFALMLPMWGIVFGVVVVRWYADHYHPEHDAPHRQHEGEHVQRRPQPEAEQVGQEPAEHEQSDG